MEDTRIYIHEITNDILDTYFPQVDTLSSLITPDPIRATRIIVNRIIRTLDMFENYCPLTATSWIKTDGDNCYTFKDNYIDIVEGRESKENLELIPKAIARIGGSALSGFSTMSVTSNYWDYHAPTLKCARSNNISVNALYHYPVYIRYTEDGYLDKCSHIFGLDAKQRNMLFNIMELEFLKMIKGYAERIKMSLSVEFFNLDTDIESAKQRVEEDQATCAAAIIAWR